MQVSRCRFWWCPRCQAVFEKEELASKIAQYRDSGEMTIQGTRTCGQCAAVYQLRDILAGRHDVPRQYWGQLQTPVELPDPARPVGRGGPRSGRRERPRSLRSAIMAWLLCLLSLASGLGILAYVIVRPLLPD